MLGGQIVSLAEIKWLNWFQNCDENNEMIYFH